MRQLALVLLCIQSIFASENPLNTLFSRDMFTKNDLACIASPSFLVLLKNRIAVCSKNDLSNILLRSFNDNIDEVSKIILSHPRFLEIEYFFKDHKKVDDFLKENETKCETVILSHLQNRVFLDMPSILSLFERLPEASKKRLFTVSNEKVNNFISNSQINKSLDDLISNMENELLDPSIKKDLLIMQGLFLNQNSSVDTKMTIQSLFLRAYNRKDIGLLDAVFKHAKFNEIPISLHKEMLIKHSGCYRFQDRLIHHFMTKVDAYKSDTDIQEKVLNYIRKSDSNEDFLKILRASVQCNEFTMIRKILSYQYELKFGLNSEDIRAEFFKANNIVLMNEFLSIQNVCENIRKYFETKKCLNFILDNDYDQTLKACFQHRMNPYGGQLVMPEEWNQRALLDWTVLGEAKRANAIKSINIIKAYSALKYIELPKNTYEAELKKGFSDMLYDNDNNLLRSLIISEDLLERNAQSYKTIDGLFRVFHASHIEPLILTLAKTDNPREMELVGRLLKKIRKVTCCGSCQFFDCDQIVD